MLYSLSVPDPASHYLHIEYTIGHINTPTLDIQLPAWRPGRYEIQNFAKNIRSFYVTDHKGNPISFQKITKDRWRLQTAGAEALTISYTYYANTQNAGTSYVDGELWYLNFINFCLYTEGRIGEPCTVRLDLPESYRIACGLEQPAHGNLHAKDYYQLVDSPLVAAQKLLRYDYEAGGIPFYCWFHGSLEPDQERLIRDFRAFSEEQLATMGEFPEQEYHFLNLILPAPMYHGVEHRNSTVIVLGPHDEGEGLYTDLLGVSSHELFHAWNIIRIRPAELLPYDFTRENYFTTCFVAEGCTTYYGDLFLRRANVFDDAAYFHELHVCMKRHFEQAGEAAQSLTESSWDLWLDGYEKGVPRRKVSVYQKGALAALILDLHIRKRSAHAKSLDDVMRLLWKRFGKPFIGYRLADYRTIAEEVAGETLDWYWQECISGNTPLEKRLNEALAFVGLEMYEEPETGIQLRIDGTPGAVRERARWLASAVR